MKKEDKERMDRTEREFYAAVKELQERIPTGQHHHNINSEGALKVLAKALGTGMAMLSDRIEAAERKTWILSVVIAAATVAIAIATFRQPRVIMVNAPASSEAASSEEAPSRKPEGPKHD